MTRSGNAISYHKSYRLTDKGTLTQQRLRSLSACAPVCAWMTFSKPQQIRAEQVPIDWAGGK